MSQRQQTEMYKYQSSIHHVSYSLVRNRTKGMLMRITGHGDVWVFASNRMPKKSIDSFVDNKFLWIVRRRFFLAQCTHLSVPDKKEKDTIRQHLHNKVSHYLSTYSGPIPKRVYIRFASTRWGSCSAKGYISLNGYLYYLPDALFEYVLIHELTHLSYLNHSRIFWSYVEQQLPDYRERRKALKYFVLPDIWTKSIEITA